MNNRRSSAVVRYGLVLVLLLLTSCTRAPSFNVVGSFFPAWLVCLIVAVLLTVITGWLLLRLHVPVAAPAVTYPGLTALLNSRYCSYSLAGKNGTLWNLISVRSFGS